MISDSSHGSDLPALRPEIKVPTRRVISLLPAGVEAGGWYLMKAPSQLYLDSSCRNGSWPTWRDLHDALRTGGTISDARMYRCFREWLTPAPTAPISQWLQLTAPSGTAEIEDQSAFKELSDCELARNAGTGVPQVHPGFSEVKIWFDKLDLGTLDLAAPDDSELANASPVTTRASREIRT